MCILLVESAQSSLTTIVATHDSALIANVGSSLCLVSTIPVPFFRCRFAVPVSRCRFRTPLPLTLPLPLRIFSLFTAVTERNFLT